MSPNSPERLTLEKLEIHKRLLMIEQYIIEGKEQRSEINSTLTTLNTRATNIELMIHGDPNSLTKYLRDGINRRVDALEEKEDNDKKIKGNFLKIAVGAITLAVGSFVLWMFKLIWAAIGK